MIKSIELTPQLIEKCQQFALDRIGLSEELYRKRGENRKSKMVEDIKVGTMAEWAVFRYLTENMADCAEISAPDMEIYDKKSKTFSADLVYTAVNQEVRFHVKSQTYKSAKAYGASWLFQKEDKLFKDPDDSEYLVFCLVEGDRVDIKAIVNVRDIIEAELLDQPKVWKYRHSKRAIYLDHVLESDINLECF